MTKHSTKNVLFAHNVADIGGAEKVTLSIVQGTHESDTCMLPFLIAPVDGPLIAEAKKLGASSAPLCIKDPSLKAPVQSLLDTIRCIRFLKRNRIKVVHTGDLFITRKLLLAVKLLKLQLVCHIHFPVTLPTLRWVFFFQPSSIMFVYCSHELCEKISPLASQVLPNEQHKVIHNGVNTKMFEPVSEKPKLKNGVYQVGIVANLQERKGHDDLIKAAKHLHDQGKQILFHIIGGDVFGESREQLLKDKVEKLGLSESFCFHGQVTDVHRKLSELDIYVCSSHVEAFPISLLEAMAHQLPIVSTNVNGIPEMLTHREHCLLVEAHSPVQLAGALSELMDDETLRVRLASNARRRVVERFSDEVFRAQCLLLYQG